MRSAAEALSFPPPTEKEAPRPLISVDLSAKKFAVNGMVIKVPPRMWEAFLSLAKKPEEGIAGQELAYVTRGAGTSGEWANYAGYYLKRDLNEKVSFGLITRTGPVGKSQYRLNAEVEMVEEAPKPLAGESWPVKGVVFDARLIESPGKEPLLHDAPPEIKLFVQKAIQGDAESFGQLYELYADRVYRHFYFRTGNNEVAEDLVAQVFVNAYQAIGRYKDTGKPFIVWLLSIAHNLLTDYYRAKRDTTNIEDVVISDVNPENDPTAVAERQSDKEVLGQALGKLKRDQQAVVVMRYIDEMDYPEIAAVLKKSEGAVRIILHRGLLALRGIMGTEKATVLPKKEDRMNKQSAEERFSYKALANILEMNMGTLWQSVVTAEKRGQLELSTNPNPGGGNGKFRFTRKDVAAVLTFLGKDPSLATQL